MKKVKNRAFSALILAFAVIIGMGLYVYRYATQGEMWATFTASSQVVTNEGKLISGTVLDRNGIMLAKAENSSQSYSDDPLIRTATLQQWATSREISAPALSAPFPTDSPAIIPSPASPVRVERSH